MLLVDRMRVQGPDHPATIGTRNDVVFFRAKSGDVARAVRELEEVLADWLRVVGPDDPASLNTRHSLAAFRGEAGDFAGAVAELTDLVADRQRALGPFHPETLGTRNDLAFFHAKAGKGSRQLRSSGGSRRPLTRARNRSSRCQEQPSHPRRLPEGCRRCRGCACGL